jgi:hypothetical protein
MIFFVKNLLKRYKTVNLQFNFDDETYLKAVDCPEIFDEMI